MKNLILIVSFILLSFFSYIAFAAYNTNISDTEIPEVINIHWGTITKINNCKTLKHNLRYSPDYNVCDISTKEYYFKQMKMELFPSEKLNIGDRIGIQTHLYTTITKTHYYKNNKIKHNSSCLYWTECYEKYLFKKS